MANDGMTSIQIDKETRKKLKELAEANERSAAGQLRWLVNQEYDKINLPQPPSKKQKPKTEK